MKATSIATFVALLVVGYLEESFDFDDHATRNRIIAEAIDFGKLHEKSPELYYAPNQQKPYTGWAKFTDATSVPMGTLYAYVTKVQ